jgi:hypothetical protein
MAAKLTTEIKRALEDSDSLINDDSLQSKQDLLSAAKQLVEKLEAPEVGIWKVVFGVSNCRILCGKQAQINC